MLESPAVSFLFRPILPVHCPSNFPSSFRNKLSNHPPSLLRCSCSLSPSPPPSPSSVSSPPQFDISAAIRSAIDALKKPTIAAILVGLLFLYDPSNPAALAASGGRVGGSSFSRSSSSYSSRSYTVPRGSDSSFIYSTPFYGPSPYGAAYGFGIGGSSLFYIIAGCAAFVLVSGFLSDKNEGVLTETEKTSVLKLQVGLLGTGRSLQQKLNKIASVADTSSPEGLSYVLSETVLSLLRHPDYCISGYSSVDLKRSIEDGERRFNQLSIEERGKFDEETLVNVNNIKRTSTRLSKSGFRNEYIVITILVAAEGVIKLPGINESANLKEALQKLGSIPSNKLLGVEVLWTPQDEDDTLNEQELLQDYPLLRPL